VLQPLPLPKARLEAVTDGIFAVTMTLLVLDLKFDERMPANSPHPIRDLLILLPYIDDYIISFVVLCVFWLGHLRMIRRLREVDATFTWLNLAFLLFTTFVPPLTSWIGHNSEHPGAAIVYGANLILILLFEALMWRHAARHLVNETVTDARALWVYMRKRYLIAAGVIMVGIIGALIEIEVDTKVGYASYVYLLLIGVGIFRPGKRVLRAAALQKARAAGRKK
jgi:uncharacterized membrane protein